MLAAVAPNSKPMRPFWMWNFGIKDSSRKVTPITASQLKLRLKNILCVVICFDFFDLFLREKRTIGQNSHFFLPCWVGRARALCADKPPERSHGPSGIIELRLGSNQ